MIFRDNISQTRVRDPYKNTNSIEFKFRVKRFAKIQDIIQEILNTQGFCDVLDLGGSEKYWAIGKDFVDKNQDRLHFTIVNSEAQENNNPSLFTFLVADACDPNLFQNQRFDFVHSNSVIEHVGDELAMRRFAANTVRLGRRYYMQTPNYWFFYEPHFRFPGFQWLPAALRAYLMTKMRLGFFEKQNSYAKARWHVDSIKLLSKRDVSRFFPDAKVNFEKAYGLSKSIMAVR